MLFFCSQMQRYKSWTIYRQKNLFSSFMVVMNWNLNEQFSLEKMFQQTSSDSELHDNLRIIFKTTLNKNKLFFFCQNIIK